MKYDDNDPISAAKRRNEEAGRNAYKKDASAARPPQSEYQAGVDAADPISAAKLRNEEACRTAWRGDKSAIYANVSGPLPSQEPMNVVVGGSPSGGTDAAKAKAIQGHCKNCTDVSCQGAPSGAKANS